MNTIYKPLGPAAEYAPLAVNLYTGCAHKCQYCYNRRAPWVNLDEFDNPRERTLLQELDHKAASLAGDPRTILLCFSCDPYGTADTALTRQALLILEKHRMRVTILTKGGLAATRDFDLLARNKWSFGTSLTFIDDHSRSVWEPDAASVQSRIAAIQDARARGIHTWISIEPVIYPWESLSVIEHTREFCDEYRIGKWNHDLRAHLINWPRFAADVNRLADRLNIRDRITLKKDLTDAAEAQK